MLVLFIIGMSQLDSYPFYYGHPDYVASIRLMSAITHDSGKEKIIANKNFFLKKSLIEVNILIETTIYCCRKKKKY